MYEHISGCRKQRVLCIIFISINIKMKKGIINGTHYIPDVSQISTAQKKTNKILHSIQNRAMCTEKKEEKNGKKEEKMNYSNNNTVQTLELITSAPLISLRQRIDDDLSNE